MPDSGDSKRGDRPDLDTLLPLLELPPPASVARAAFGAASKRGKARSVNEDHYFVIRLGREQETVLSSLPAEALSPLYEEFGYAMAVADGMSGAGHGETASRLALVTLLYLVRYFGKWNLRIDDTIAREIMQRAQRFYRHVDTTVVHRRQKAGVRDLQTTLTAVFGAGRDLFFAHVGHSRAYLFRDGQLMRLTRDHALGFERSTPPLAPLVDINATGRDLAHILTDTIGMDSMMGPQIDLERIRVHDKDVVLVSTNGVSDFVDDTAIGEILGNRDTPDAQSGQLVDRAMAAGGEDDATAVVAHYTVPE